MKFEGENLRNQYDMEEKLKEVLQSVTGNDWKEDCHGKSLIEDLALDSVALMQLAAELEEKFNVNLDEAPSLLELFDSYDKLLTYLEENVSK